MKKTIAVAMILGALAASQVQANEYLAKDGHEIKVEAVLDENGSNDGDPTLGFEVAYGESLYDFDMVSLFVGHRENTDQDFSVVGVQFDEHYDVDNMYLTPYLGVGFGYTWTEVDNAEDLDGFLVRGEAGVRHRISERMDVSFSAKYEWTEHHRLLKDGEVDDKNWTFGLGLRFNY